MFSDLVETVKQQISSNKCDEQDNNFVHLKSWRSGSIDKLDVAKKLALFKDPEESVTINFSFSSPTQCDPESLIWKFCNEDLSYNYRFILCFNNFSYKLKHKYAYKISFHVSCTEHSTNKTFRWDCLFERKEARTKDVMEFSGEFIPRQLYLNFEDQSITYNLYCHVERYDRKEEVSENGENLAELEREVEELHISEYNLLVQLQESDQQTQRVIELQESIKQLKIDAEKQKAQHEAEVEKLTERLMCHICCSNEANVVWIPCGHAKFCENCICNNQLNGVRPNHCMLCRQPGSWNKFIL